MWQTKKQNATFTTKKFITSLRKIKSQNFSFMLKVTLNIHFTNEKLVFKYVKWQKHFSNDQIHRFKSPKKCNLTIIIYIKNYTFFLFK